MSCAAVGAIFVMGCGGGDGIAKHSGRPSRARDSPKRLTPKPKPHSTSPAEPRPAPDSPAPAARATTRPAGDPCACRRAVPPAASFTPSATTRSHSPPLRARRLAARRSPNGEAVATSTRINANGHAMVFRRPRRRARRLRNALVLRLATHASEWAAGFVPARRRAIHKLHTTDLRRPVRAQAGSLQERRADPHGDRRDRRPGHADAHRPLLREPALDRVRSRGALGPGCGRHLGVLRRAAGMDTGRSDRHPRHERSVVDRARRLPRLHPAPRTTCCAGCSKSRMRERLSSSRPDTSRRSRP